MISKELVNLCKMMCKIVCKMNSSCTQFRLSSDAPQNTLHKRTRQLTVNLSYVKAWNTIRFTFHIVVCMFYIVVYTFHVVVCTFYVVERNVHGVLYP